MNTNILRSPILSEKAYKHMEKGIYTFMVDTKSDKKQIAKIIESQFNVKVTKVNVSKKARKSKRIANSRKEVLVGGGKKATVWLAKGQSIAILSPKSEKKDKKVSKESKVSKGKESDNKKEIKENDTKKGLFSRFSKSDDKRKEKSK